ncbi:hypothetical protein P153DRAFT_407201 [Dothidotthia symphoricarpi CBS 119687]|uniref:BTB domain-containing protein n=1 Tax=Dothidotthia symphoricarpi CBS 119687 TaxID=1392245 RepID=A0A6A6A6X9_9PLEO|nr:uncharacterized protein P153DRAFT_407201 [Dothidotthia symphoricarpi CBS 119687]KAF2126883.1 hypothetical protein P153DRAFT_407201 [Dothidotthia symphoricarpi CBS 119687]
MEADQLSKIIQHELYQQQTDNLTQYIVSSPEENETVICICITNSTGASQGFVVHKSVVLASNVLCNGLNSRMNPEHPLIRVQWHGTLDVFDIYHAWLYSHKALTSAELKSKQPPTVSTKSDYTDLICCWGMGQTLRDETYQDMVMSSIINRLQRWTSSLPPPFIYAQTASTVVGIYRETTADASLRKLIVDAVARSGTVVD